MNNAQHTRPYGLKFFFKQSTGFIIGLMVLSLQLFACNALAADEIFEMDKPVAYCLSKLEDCKPDKQIQFTDKVPSDMRALNGGTQDPVTLVYDLPDAVISTQVNDKELLISGSFRNYCFLFDNNPQQTYCTNKKTIFLPIQYGAKKVLSQQIAGVDVRIFKPTFLVGGQKSLLNKQAQQRNPTLVFVGWYLFLMIISLTTALTKNNRNASLALAGFAAAMLLRTVVFSNYSYADINLPEINWYQKIIQFSTCLAVMCAVLFYSMLLGEKLKSIISLNMGIGLIIILSIIPENNPLWSYYNTRVSQIYALISIIIILIQIKFVLQIVSLQERLVIIFGGLIAIVGALLDTINSLVNIPQINLLTYAFALESICQFILLSIRNNKTHLHVQQLQKKEIESQAKLVSYLEQSEKELNQKVKERTSELEIANSQILSAYNTADALRIKAETAQQETAQALTDLQAAQTQLIQAEKMASLGLLVSNVAHEINTPIGAVKSSGALIADTLDTTLADMPKLFSLLDPVPRGLFVQLITSGRAMAQQISSREERALAKSTTAVLQEANVEDANRKAKLLIKFRAHERATDYLPLLNHPQADFILEAASNIASIISGTNNINTAVEKVSRVVYALKALSGDDIARAVTQAPLQPDMDKALAKYQNQMHGVELITNFQSDMPAIHADHDAMEQLCIHLVMNALQAMNYEGKLTVGLSAKDNQAIISVSDTGTGIADDIKGRIFEPFFTTRLSGEGSGMGLAIVKRIVEQHQGKIEVQTEIGVGTTITVMLPYTT